jgi:threonine dehydrogenase-like Zn-dependent dehydrogenase
MNYSRSITLRLIPMRERRKLLWQKSFENLYERGEKEMADTAQIEAIVKQVLASMSGGTTAAPAESGSAGGAIPKTAHVAMLTSLEHFDVKEFPMPEVGDDDILVKVEGCGVCGTDAHEFKRDPFGLIPVALGHEGTGEIVKMGKNVKKDSAGKDLKLGDKVVTCMIFKDNPDITMYDLNKQNVGGADVYGLLPDDDIHLNGWFSDYILIRGGSTVFNVSDLDLYSRVLIEPCAVLIHAVERAKSTGILRFNSRVVVQGCGPIGLICIAILRTMGINKIVAVDGEQKRLDFAKELGASDSVNFKEHKGIEALTAAVQEKCDGHLADFAFQCTGSPAGHSNIYKFIRNGGGLCELGFFINGGDATINPHFDICSKEITTVGSWVYTLRDYATTFDFLKSAKKIGLPIDKLITHTYPLEEINEALKTNLAMTGLKIAIINK